ncbi:MAG: glycosyltransferase family 4 protein [Candidatus Omnitrophica bacterium]|nr:glycosyltransferase family 4 protein [Candidatus Omnitrophota bacterium]
MNQSPKSQQPHFVFLRLMPPVVIWGGLEKLMLEWFERIDTSQCRATLIVSNQGGDIYRNHIKTKKLDIDVIEFPFRKDFRYTQGFWGRFRKVTDLLKPLKPTKVIFFQGSFTDFDLSHVLAANLLAGGEVFMHENLGAPEPSAKSSKKYFGVIPGVGLWWYAEKYFNPWRAKFCKKIYVVSAEIRQRMIDLWNYPMDKLEVLYHGVDTARFHPSESSRKKLRSVMGISESETVIIVAARLSQEKCIDRAIDAFDALITRFPNLQLLIAGTGPYEERLKTLAQQKASSARIKFLGQVNNVNELYQMSDIYVLSSDNEGLSLAFLEALGSGLVCVATRCTGTTEVIDDGRNGFLVEKSLDGVRSGLQKALSLSVQERHAMGHEAVSDVAQRFEIHRNVRNGLNKMGIPLKPVKDC